MGAKCQRAVRNLKIQEADPWRNQGGREERMVPMHPGEPGDSRDDSTCEDEYIGRRARA